MLIAPAAARTHRAFGVRVPLAMAGGAVAVDVARFAFGVEGVQWANLLLVWAFTHQLGFFWPRLAAAGRGVAWALALAGLTGLAVLTNIGVYSRSMVGVTGEPVSNMGPPTVCILALTLLQTGVILLLREPAERWLEGPRPRRLVQWAGGRAMTVYLWHFPAFAAAYGLVRLAGIEVPERASAAWWLQRPVWVLLPALCILPFVGVFRRFERRPQARAGYPGGTPSPAGAVGSSNHTSVGGPVSAPHRSATRSTSRRPQPPAGGSGRVGVVSPAPGSDTSTRRLSSPSTTLRRIGPPPP